MLAAAFGALVPIAGAVAQEALDVAVILNALRAARDPSLGRRRRQQIADCAPESTAHLEMETCVSSNP
jgi:hypothetical protein